MSWKIHGKGKPVKEVWEDFYGNLWFVTELPDADDVAFGYARLYHMPDYAEWGSFRWCDIEDAVGKNLVWKINERNWGNIETYEKGLLVKT